MFNLFRKHESHAIEKQNPDLVIDFLNRVRDLKYEFINWMYSRPSYVYISDQNFDELCKEIDIIKRDCKIAFHARDINKEEFNKINNVVDETLRLIEYNRRKHNEHVARVESYSRTTEEIANNASECPQNPAIHTGRRPNCIKRFANMERLF